LPQLDHHEEALLERLRDTEVWAVWSLINSVVADQPPCSRTAGKTLRLEWLGRLKRLRELGLAFLVGRNRISATKPDPAKRQPAIRRRRPSVVKSRYRGAVSAAIPSGPAVPVKPVNLTQAIQLQTEIKNPVPSAPAVEVGKTQSVTAPEVVSAAARQLATLPRNQRRKFTGWLHGEHCWRGRLLVLPGGEVLPLSWCNRGRALMILSDAEVQISTDHEYFTLLCRLAPREVDVRIYKHPEAMLLGSRKAGVKERASLAKAAAARRNGCMPPRPGSRPRGRPRKVTAPVGPTPLSAGR
jgi:hypothetical protein